MSTEVKTFETIPAWLPHGMLRGVLEDASKNDPARANHYAGVDAERVRRAVKRSDAILRAHCRYSDDDVVDVTLARSVLLVAGAMMQSGMVESDG